MKEILTIPYSAFNNDWDLLQKFLQGRGNPRYELVGNVDLRWREDIFDLGNLVRVDGDLRLGRSSIKSLGILERVDGYLYLRETPIESLGILRYIGSSLYLTNSQINSLGELEYIGNSLDLIKTSIQSLGKLKYVGNAIVIPENHQIPEEQLIKFKIIYW